MSDSHDHRSRNVHRPGWRGSLDLLATILMIAASGVLIWRLIPASSARSAAAPPAGESVQPVLPTQPVALDVRRVHGSASARAVLIEYSDFQCPFCARFARETWPTLWDRYVSSGKLQVIFRHLPLGAIHPKAFRAAEGAECAGVEGKFWQMHDLLFAEPSRLDTSDVLRNARSLNLNESRFAKCLQGEMKGRVDEDVLSAGTLEVSGTPTFFLGKRLHDGTVLLTRRMKGAKSAKEFAVAIDEILSDIGRDKEGPR